MVDIPTPLLLLLPLAVGAGADLFLSILVVFLAWNLGGNGTVPEITPGMPWLILAVPALLYLVELLLEIRPRGALFWHTLQQVVRPVGCALLAWEVAEYLPIQFLIPALALAALTAALVHGVSWGAKLWRFLHPDPAISPLIHGLAEDALILFLLVLAPEHPEMAAILALTFLLLAAVAGRGLGSVARLGHHLIRDRVWGIVSPTRWQSSPKLPPWVERWRQAQGLQRVRGLPALAHDLPGLPRLRGGWLLETENAHFFGFSSLGSPRVISLAEFQAAPPTVKVLCSLLPLRNPDGSDSALFLQKRAPVEKSHKW